MFFMMGITDGRKDLDFSQQMICNVCGRYGRYQVFMTYTVLSLFFIPCFKWNKHYYVTTSCCGSMYELDSEIGKEIERGSSVEIRPGYLRRVDQGRYSRSEGTRLNSSHTVISYAVFCLKKKKKKKRRKKKKKKTHTLCYYIHIMSQTKR